MSGNLPFAVEYAKSNHSSCKQCPDLVGKNSLRIAIMIQSSFFDGMDKIWHHSSCFWSMTAARRRGMADTDFQGLTNLRWEDQQAVRAMIGPGGYKRVPEAPATPDNTADVSDFAVQLAKSGKTVCRICAVKIQKDELRVSVKEKREGRFGLAWYHLGCFAASLERLNFTFKPEEICGFDNLHKADQNTVMSTVKPMKRRAETNGDNKAAKKAKKEEPMMSAETANIKEQSEAMWKIRDLLRQLKKKEMCDLLTHNGQGIPKGESRILDRLSDVIYFGPLVPCSVCTNGQFVYSTSINAYRCVGQLSEWSRCEAKVDTPGRESLSVPAVVLKAYPWLGAYVGSSGRFRVLPANRPDPTKSLEQIASQAASYVAANADRRYNASKRNPYGDKSFASSVKSAKYTVKNGAAVEDCEVAKFTHVFRDAEKQGLAGQPWTAVLNSVDVSSSKNTYYKLQLLQHDRKPNRFYLFRSWGRIGTTIGGDKVDDFHDLQDAKDVFEHHYLKKSGNLWTQRDKFVKRPHKLYPVEVDYGEAAAAGPLVAPGSKSLLPNPVKELIKLIFDVDAMKETMMQFEIDLTKMPLGKLSKNRINQAYSVLTDLQNMMGASGGVSEPQAVDASNRFYTLVPHDFGMEKPTLLRTAELIRTKTDMLDALMEIEVAYSILQSARDSHEEDPIDAQYKGLDSNIHPLEKSSSEYKMLAKYVANTHAPTHTMYRLEVEEIFRVERAGEAAAFAGGVGNRALLWHGSRTSNYAGILAQGLRIAPPEAPVTGYMFGKGVYFADMLSMFSDYCHAPRDGPGLLMLCDAALGESWELKKATMVTPAMLKKEKKHSTKGLGQTAPNPASDVVKDGVRIPLGKSVDTNIDGTTLLYNEYIVYDVNQVNIKYLFRTKFVYK